MLKEGFTFQLTDEGVGDLELELMGDAGAVFLKVDQTNQKPDFEIEITRLDLDYIAEVVNLFSAPETIPDGTTGQIFGSVHMKGTTGQFQEGDYLLVQGLDIPDMVNGIDIAVDIKGSLNQLQPFISVTSSCQELGSIAANIPTISGQPDCDRPLWMSAKVQEFQLTDLVQYFPLVPTADVVAVFEG